MRSNASRHDGNASHVSLLSSASSGSLFSDISSGTSSTNRDAGDRRPAPFRQKSDGPSRRTAAGAVSRPPQPRPSGATSAAKEASFECPFCAEADISRSIARKSDLKRHFLQFHHTNTVWTCSLPGCGSAFDWKSAYEGHLKDIHRGVHRDEAGVDTCPQVVFGCGFGNCKQVYEAVSDADASSKAAEYFAHVANHFNAGDSHKDWSYSARLRNLMRQARIDEVWKSRTRHRDRNDRLRWHLQTSSTLRKMLETRHVPDVPLLVKWAVILGSTSPAALRLGGPELPRELAIPDRRLCYMTALDHFQEPPYDVPTSSGESTSLRHTAVVDDGGKTFSPLLAPLGPGGSSALPYPDPMDHHRPGQFLVQQGRSPHPVPSISLGVGPDTTMPLAPDTLESVRDVLPDRITHQHPLPWYHGFSQTTTAGLISPPDVIADSDKKSQSNPLSPVVLLPGDPPLSFPEHHVPQILGDGMNPVFDVQMADASLSSGFYMGS